MTFAPVVPNLPSTQGAIDNKYGGNSPYTSGAVLQALASLPQPQLGSALRAPLPIASVQNTISPLALYDQTRAARGLMPLTARQSRAALETLRTQQPATQPRRQGIFSASLSDLRSLVGAIPKLPMLAVHEAKALADLPSLLPKAQSGNPIHTIGNLATLPGLRMIPGAFVAQQLAADKAHGGQGVEGLRAHPLFTALDLLPAADSAAHLAPVVKAARAEAEATNLARVEQAVATTGLPGTADLLPKPRALQTALTRTLDEAGNVVPNRLGEHLARNVDAFYSTDLGRAFQATFKERQLPQFESRDTSALREAADLRNPTAALSPTAQRFLTPQLSALRDSAIEIKSLMDEAGITPERSDELYKVSEDPAAYGLTAPEQLPDLTPQESGVLTKIRDFQQARALATEGDLTRIVTVDGSPEVYDLTTAKKLTGAQRATNATREMVEAREAVTNPSSLGDNPVAQRDAIQQRLSDITRRRDEGTLPRGQADLLTRHYLEALDEAGWRWTGADGQVLDAVSHGDEWAGATLQQVSRPAMEDLLVALKPLERRYSTIPRLIDHLRNGQWSTARSELDAFAATRAGDTLIDTLPFDIDGLKEELSRLSKRDRLLNSPRSAAASTKRLERLEKLQARVEAQAVPARFVPEVNRIAREGAEARVREIYSGDPDLEHMVDLAHKEIYGPISELGADELRTLQREARASWQALRDAGHDPIFFSRSSPMRKASQQYIRVSDTPVTPAAAKARMWDATPYQTDMGVAVTKDALDLIQRRAVDQFLTDFSGTYGKTRAQLEAELLPRAEQRHLTTPSISVKQHLANLVDERWAPWDANKYSPKRTPPALSISSRDSIMVPRVMSENMERLFTPPLPRLTGALDPVMKVFRTAVLPLAPRWHLYNAIGGAVMTAVHDPMAFRYLPEVIKDLWDSRGSLEGPEGAAKHIPGAPPAGFGTVPQEVRSWDRSIKSTSPYKDRLAATHNYAAGRTLSNWYESAREGRIGKIKDGAARAIERSYSGNQMVDDMYRSAVGISAKKRALKAGASDAMAEAAAVASIRKVFQSWDRMTPMERSVMRTVVPFYGWSSHVLKYAMSYPFDHPFRVAVVGSLARAELADAATGLPDYIRDMILMGDTRANGVVKGINVGPFNPFRDIPSMFTVAGFLGNLNPVLTGVLESVGVNVQQGGPQLYPEMRYDPETGRLQAQPSGNLASNIFGNILPQAELFTALAGRNDSFNSMLKRDPSAAGRMLMSNLGIPVLYKDINVGDQLIRAEMARYDDEQTARKKALSSGDLSILNDFPGLKAYGEQLRALNKTPEGQQALASLRPAQGSPGLPTRTDLAYAVQAGLLGKSA